jgi:hypothetical protein
VQHVHKKLFSVLDHARNLDHLVRKHKLFVNKVYAEIFSSTLVLSETLGGIWETRLKHHIEAKTSSKTSFALSSLLGLSSELKTLLV